MLDIREMLKALDPQDRLLWAQHRTEIRRSFLSAHNTTVGVVNWDAQDDALLDLMDIRLVLLFDRAGRFNSVKEVANVADSAAVENELHRAVDRIKANVKEITPKVATFSDGASAATAMMRNHEWAN